MHIDIHIGLNLHPFVVASTFGHDGQTDTHAHGLGAGFHLVFFRFGQRKHVAPTAWVFFCIPVAGSSK